MSETDRAWRFPKMSPWLIGYIFFTSLAASGILTLYWQRNHGGSFRDAFWGMQRSGFSMTSLLLTIPFLAWLVWFTFFSNSRLVKKDDKIFVLLMFAGSVVGGTVQLLHFLFTR